MRETTAEVRHGLMRMVVVVVVVWGYGSTFRLSQEGDLLMSGIVTLPG